MRIMSNIESLEERLPSEAKEQNSKGDVPLKERFFRYFQHEITGIVVSPAPGVPLFHRLM